jgi:hypothetical protein
VFADDWLPVVPVCEPAEPEPLVPLAEEPPPLDELAEEPCCAPAPLVIRAFDSMNSRPDRALAALPVPDVLPAAPVPLVPVAPPDDCRQPTTVTRCCPARAVVELWDP